MPGRRTLVVTSIAGPNERLAALAHGAAEADVDFVLVGDEASPPDFRLAGCDFFGLDDQRALPFALAKTLPTRHYARKNLGYLIAMQRGAPTIVETDDDTIAHPGFWDARSRHCRVELAAGKPWVNVYRYFADGAIWPRGFPLDDARAPVAARDALEAVEVDCPIQQGLVDVDPDVDALFRMLEELPFSFDDRPSVALDTGSWCPFNSQNTTWWRDAYPLMYLPATCSFRMTDIWRSFVAQRVAWVNGWRVLFHSATISQSRNDHDLMRDFRDEIPGYVGNRAICAELDELDLGPGREHVAANVWRCYETLVAGGWLEARELVYLAAWLADVQDHAEPLVDDVRLIA